MNTKDYPEITSGGTAVENSPAQIISLVRRRPWVTATTVRPGERIWRSVVVGRIWRSRRMPAGRNQQNCSTQRNVSSDNCSVAAGKHQPITSIQNDSVLITSDLLRLASNKEVTNSVRWNTRIRAEMVCQQQVWKAWTGVDWIPQVSASEQARSKQVRCEPEQQY